MDVETATYWLGWVRFAQLIAVFLVAIGVVAEFAGEWTSRPLESIIDHARELQIAQLEKDAETARASIAEANAHAAEAAQKAAEAQLALEKFKAPRRLTAGQRSSIKERMLPFSGTEFAISANGPESIDFATDIAESLKAAGWSWINWPLGGIVSRLSGGRPEIGLDMMRGIEAHIFDNSLEPLATELFLSLTTVGYKCQWVLMSPPKGGLKNTVIIVIGSKEE